jgi:hypothetical protein
VIVSCPHCNSTYGLAASRSSRLKNRRTDIRRLYLVMNALRSRVAAYMYPIAFLKLIAYTLFYRCSLLNIVVVLLTSSSFIMGVYFNIRVLVTSGAVFTTRGLDLFSGAYLKGWSVSVVPSN